MVNGKVRIKYYDPNENHFFEKGDHPIDYQRLFSRYGIITVLALKGRPLANNKEEEKIRNKMTRIMTGNMDYLKETRVLGGTISKKKNMG